MKARRNNGNPASGGTVAALREEGWSEPIGPATILTIEVRPPAITHTVTVQHIMTWTESAALTPKRGFANQFGRALIPRGGAEHRVGTPLVYAAPHGTCGWPPAMAGVET